MHFVRPRNTENRWIMEMQKIRKTTDSIEELFDQCPPKIKWRSFDQRNEVSVHLSTDSNGFILKIKTRNVLIRLAWHKVILLWLSLSWKMLLTYYVIFSFFSSSTMSQWAKLSKIKWKYIGKEKRNEIYRVFLVPIW